MRILLVVMLMVMIGAEFANASLIGDRIDARWEFIPHNTDITNSYIVGQGPEGKFPLFIGNTILDIGADSISVDYGPVGGGSQSAGTIWTFSSLDFSPSARVSGVFVDTNWLSWSDSFISYGDNYVKVEFLNDVSFDSASDYWIAAIVTIPEPTHVMLLCIVTTCSFNCRTRLT